MSVYTVVGLVSGPLAVIYLLVSRRSIKLMRAGDEEWRQRWRQLPRERRKAILERMKKGEPVEREDAELSIRAVRQIEHVRKAMRPMTLVGGIALGFILIAGIVSGSTWLMVGAAVGLGGGEVFDLLSRRQRRRFQQSVEATERLVGQ